MSTQGHRASGLLMIESGAGDPAEEDQGAEPSLGEALLDMLELVSRQRPDLLRWVVEALFSSSVRRVSASVGEKLGGIHPERICELFEHHACAVDRLERDGSSPRKLQHRRATRLLAAVCQARGRNVSGRRRLRLFEIERKLRDEIATASAAGAEVAEA